jgi:hypothetical protein
MSKDECQELKNIKYKTMLLNGNKNVLSTVINDISNLDLLLEEESELNKKVTWNKLDKSIKMNKINEYIKTLSKKHQLTSVEIKTLKDFLSQNLDKKNLQKNKDVTYIKELGKLENIPSLHFNNSTRKFSLKKQQLLATTKSLGPTRKKKSKTNKTTLVNLNTPRSPKSSQKSVKNSKVEKNEE